MRIPFELPPVISGGEVPVWQGNGFRIGAEMLNVLQYSKNLQGWNDGLTSLHEETAGENHFIDLASRRYTLQQIKKHVIPPKPVILEIGCSSGFMLKELRSTYPYAVILGSDVVYEPLISLSKAMPDIPIFRFDLLNCPLPSNSMDAIILLNVLEHIQDDQTALQQIYRLLKPGGIAIIEVPSGPHLYDAYDKVLMHYRRYTLSALQKIVTEQSFKILKKSHLGCFIYPGFWLVKQRNKRYLTEQTAKQRSIVENNIKKTSNNKLMNFIMRIELKVGEKVNYPFGIRCLMTCIKSS